MAESTGWRALPKLIPHSGKKIKETVQSEGSLKRAAAVLGCHPDALGRLLRREHGTWWPDFKRAKRTKGRTARRRRLRHKREAEKLAALCESTPGAWETLTVRQQILVQKHRAQS